MSVIFFKFKGSRAAKEKITFDGLSISEQELKNAIAEMKGLDTSKDQYVLCHPETHVPFPPTQTYVRNMSVEVKREPLPQGMGGRGRPQQAADAAAAADDPTANQAMAAAQALSAAAAAAAADPNAQQPDAKLMREMEAQAVTNMAQAAWQAQTDQHIRNAQQREQEQRQQGRGRGGGFGRGFGRGPGSNQPPPICRNCGAVGGLHWPDECPNPKSNVRQVRAPTGIPSSFLKDSEEGGLLLNTGRTAAVTADAAAAKNAFAAIPSARRAALARQAAQVPAIADRPHDAADDALLGTLLLENEPAANQQQQQQGQQEQQQQQRVQHMLPLANGLQQHQQQHDGNAAQPGAVAGAAQQQQDASAPAGAAAAAAGATAAAGGGGLFDDEDLLPPAAAAQGGGLNLGAGMELDKVEQQQQQPPRSPLPARPQQQLAPRSPLVQAVCEEGKLDLHSPVSPCSLASTLYGLCFD